MLQIRQFGMRLLPSGFGPVVGVLADAAGVNDGLAFADRLGVLSCRVLLGELAGGDDSSSLLWVTEPRRSPIRVPAVAWGIQGLGLPAPRGSMGIVRWSWVW